MSQNYSGQRTHSYHSSAGQNPLLGITMSDLVDQMASLYPDKDYLVDLTQNKRVTFAQFQQAVNKVSKALIALGIKAEDKVATLSMNHWQWPVMHYAIGQIGGCSVNLNPALRQDQLAELIEHADCRYIFVRPSYKSSDYFKMFRGICPEATDGHQDIISHSLPKLKRLISLEDGAPGFMAWEEFLQGAEKIDDIELNSYKESVDCNSIAWLCYTSGTTGMSKGAVRTQHNLINNPYVFGQAIELRPEDVLCTNFLYFHSGGHDGGFGLALTHGVTIVIPSPDFSPEATIEAFIKEGCTVYTAAPTMYQRILDCETFGRLKDKISLRAGVVGASSCAPELIRHIISELKMEVCNTYGGTEMGIFSLTRFGDTFEQKTQTVGTPSFHTEATIVDAETGVVLKIDEPGEVCTRGFNVMEGYYKQPELNAQILDKRGWYHSRDLGVMDAKGFIRILGRVDDMIIRGGENIFPAEIEDILLENAALKEVAVVGVPDPLYGHEIAAWVVCREGEISPEELTAYCKTKLAFYQIPKWFFMLDEMPITSIGKPDKIKLRHLADRKIRQL